jgi:hypothetical protein
VSRGGPAAGRQVTVLLADGNEGQVSGGADGRTRTFDQRGRYGAWARVVEPKAGEHDGKKYGEVRHYPTIVIDADSERRESIRSCMGERS